MGRLFNGLKDIFDEVVAPIGKSAVHGTLAIGGSVEDSAKSVAGTTCEKAPRLVTKSTNIGYGSIRDIVVKGKDIAIKSAHAFKDDNQELIDDVNDAYGGVKSGVRHVGASITGLIANRKIRKLNVQNTSNPPVTPETARQDEAPETPGHMFNEQEI